MGEGQRDRAKPSIYGERTSPASDARHADGWLARALTGFVLGVAIWMLIARLRLPHIFGFGATGGELPLGLAGALLGLTRFRTWLLWISVSLIAVLAVVSMTNIVVRPSRSLIRVDPLPGAADAVVVLSAGVTGDGFMPQQGSDRLRKALELVRSGVAPTLVLTRERRFIDKVEVSTDADQDSLIALVGISSVVKTEWVTSTRAEAVQVARLARQRGWKRIVLVTSPFHSRRACATFEAAGIQVSCAPAQSRDIAVRSLRDPDDRVAAFGMLIYEAAGMLRYRQLGWI